MHRSGIVESYGSSSLNYFLRNLHTVLHSSYNLQSYQQCYLFSTSIPTFAAYCLFDNGHSDRCEVISHYGFNLHFPDYE